MAQPGIEPGSPDYRSDALTTQPLNQPHWERILLYNTHTVLSLRWSGPRRQFYTFSAIRITLLTLLRITLWPCITDRPGSPQINLVYIYISKSMKNESLPFLCFCATRFTAVAALQAEQSVFINLLRHRCNSNYNHNGFCNSRRARAINVISSH